MINEPPSHLADKYRLFAIWFDADYGSRPTQNMIIVHVAENLPFNQFFAKFIAQHLEFTIVKTGEKLSTQNICGIQKIKNDNKPHYELTAQGLLKDLT